MRRRGSTDRFCQRHGCTEVAIRGDFGSSACHAARSVACQDCGLIQPLADRCVKCGGPVRVPSAGSGNQRKRRRIAGRL